MSADFDLSDVQGNVGHGYRLPVFKQLFATIDGDVARFREFLARLEPLVARGHHAREQSATLNVGISYAGLARLVPGWSAALARGFPAFSAGMAARADSLGDPPGIDWRPWDGRHLWITVHAKDEAILQRQLKRVEECAAGLPLDGSSTPGAVIERDGKRLEHFGFRDGISNPVFEGATERKRLEGNGKQSGKGWVPIARGEFLLGHVNEQENENLDELPEGLWPLLQNGTFAVLRVLDQNVAAFREYVARKQEAYRVEHGEAVDIAEKMIGRTRDGRALAAPERGNDFDYKSHDPDGARCPLGSHVRRANPRLDGEHRLIRRSIPYGRYLEPDEPVTGDRGIYFIAINASIENQFEFLQRNWINGVFSHQAGKLKDSKDPLAASGDGLRRMAIEGDVSSSRSPILLLDIPAFVTCLGGEYYFMPGIRGLSLLAGATETSRFVARPEAGQGARP
jgi:Dyp-type peroxidase family